MHLRILLITSLTFATACLDTGPGTITGRYSLATIDGRPLPTAPTASSNSVVYTAGIIQLNTDLSYVVSLTSHGTSPVTPSQTTEVRGIWSLAGTDLVFKANGQTEVTHNTINPSDQTITVVDVGTWVFRK